MSGAIDRGAQALRDQPSPVTWADVEERAADGTDGPGALGSRGRPPHHRPLRWALAVVAAALVLVAAVVWWPDPPAEEVRIGPGPTTTDDPGPTSTDDPGTDPSEPSTTTTPPTESPRTLGAVTAVTDTHYLVWGGEDATSELSRTDGFAVDLATGEVTAIPDAPFARTWGSQGAWTGSELVVWAALSPSCGPCDSLVAGAAAWDPVARSWREITPPPDVAAIESEAAVWTGDAIVTVTTSGTAAAYDPATDRWTDLPDIAPVGGDGSSASLVWTGSEVVFWSTGYDTTGYPTQGEPRQAGDVVVDRGWRWSPGDETWTSLPDLPLGHRTHRGSAVWTGTEVVVWGTATGGDGVNDVGVGARWRPGEGGWTPMAPSPRGPGRGYEGTPGSQALAADAMTGRAVVQPIDVGDGAEPSPLFTYDPASDTWTATDIVVAAYHPRLDAADGRVFVPDPRAPVAGTVQG